MDIRIDNEELEDAGEYLLATVRLNNVPHHLCLWKLTSDYVAQIADAIDSSEAPNAHQTWQPVIVNGEQYLAVMSPFCTYPRRG